MCDNNVLTILPEDRRRDEDPEDIIEECQDQQAARNLQAREPHRGQEEDDERDSQDVVQDPALCQEPAEHHQPAHGRENKYEDWDGSKPRYVDLPREAIVGVFIRVWVQKGAKS